MFSYWRPTAIFITQLCFGIHGITVERRNEGLFSVPQDVDLNVTHFFLEANSITHIDFDSFKKYRALYRIVLSDNPLKTIADGTFDNNHKLARVICVNCAIEYIPATFGPCTTKIIEIDFRQGVVNSDVLSNVDFMKFSLLDRIRLEGIALPDLDVLPLPPTLRTLIVVKTGISTLPQVDHNRFPVLTVLSLAQNKLSIEVPYSWFERLPISIKVIRLKINGIVKLPEIFPVKPHLFFLAIENNRLSTIPDMLDCPALSRLFIRNNPITCDWKMCWRRLWDRKRAPLIGKDDIQCQSPPSLRGTMLSDVNPRVMGCYNGKDPFMSRWLGGNGVFASRQTCVNDLQHVPCIIVLHKWTKMLCLASSN